MEGGDAVVEEAEEVFEEGGGFGSVAEDDGGGGEVLGRGEEDVEVAFFVGDGCLEVLLLQFGGRGERFGIDFADEEGQAAGTRLFFQREDFCGYSGGEKECLPLVFWGKDGKTGFEIGQHAASSRCE